MFVTLQNVTAVKTSTQYTKNTAGMEVLLGPFDPKRKDTQTSESVLHRLEGLTEIRNRRCQHS
jgi:hypothetical protein